MPLPLLLVPIAVTVGSAAVQAAGKLRARKELNSLRAQLSDAQTRHRRLLIEYYLRQHFLCRQLVLEPPDRPVSLLPPEPDNPEDEGRKPLWRRVIPLKPKTTLTQGSTGSAREIVGRHSFSASTSVIWRTSSASILRVVQPFGSRLVTIAPRFVTLGGGAASTVGSIAASTAVRTIIASVSVVGIVIGPAVAAWTIASEVRKIKQARRELARLLAQQDMELASFRVKNRRLEAQYAETLQATVDERELVSAR
jgi:hypothetical protein